MAVTNAIGHRGGEVGVQVRIETSGTQSRHLRLEVVTLWISYRSLLFLISRFSPVITPEWKYKYP